MAGVTSSREGVAAKCGLLNYESDGNWEKRE